MAKIPLSLLRHLPPGIAKWAGVLLLVLGYGAYDRWDTDRGDSPEAPQEQRTPRPSEGGPSKHKQSKRRTKEDKKERAQKAGKLRLFDWNLENFSGRSLSQAPDRIPSSRGRHHSGSMARGHDLSAIRSLLRDHNPDLVTFQEILEPQSLPKVFPDFEWKWTRHGGRGKQFIAFGQRKSSQISCRALPDLEQLSAGKSVRPGLRALCSYPGRPDFELLAVHLKAGSKGYDLRSEQWEKIFSALRKGKNPTIVVGDLNFAGQDSPKGPKDDQAERTLFSKRARAKVQLLESELSLPCTAYWQGENRRDGLLESSVLDGIWMRGFGQDPAPKSQVLGACEQKKCSRIPGGRGRKAAAMAGLSDHCPLLVEF